jgi:hypothetical protein
MPAVKFRCWRQNLKVLAQKTQTLLQDVEQSRCTCARPERAEAEEKERDNIVDETQKAQNRSVVISVSYLTSYFLCSFRGSRRQSGALAHLINTARLKALSSRGRGRASFCEPAWVCPNPILGAAEDRASKIYARVFVVLLRVYSH